jgi:hypothetical protein
MAAPLLADVFPGCAWDQRITLKHLHLSSVQNREISHAVSDGVRPRVAQA